MTATPIVPEGSTAYLLVTFRDKNGELVTPSSVTWEAHDRDSGAELQAPTPLVSDDTIEITIPPAVNAIHNSTRIMEGRIITIKASYGLADAANDEYLYLIRNLQHVG